MCRRETNLFFFTLGDGSLPLGRNCATCVFEKSRNRVVLDGGNFEILWRKTTSTISPLEWHLPNSYTLHMLKECWRLCPPCVFSPTESYFLFFLPDLFLFYGCVCGRHVIPFFVHSVHQWLLKCNQTCSWPKFMPLWKRHFLPWWKDSLGLFCFIPSPLWVTLMYQSLQWHAALLRWVHCWKGSVLQRTPL